MKAGILFSGGKDSTLAMHMAKDRKFSIECLITIESENKESYMFHTPSIKRVEKQSEVLDIPLIMVKTKGEKEEELLDLEKAIKKAKEKFNLDVIVTGALASKYQASRIKKICDNLSLESFNPLWDKDQLWVLEELLKRKFEVIIVGVFAYPLDKTWLGRTINKKFIKEVKELQNKFKVNPAGEGGEFETFVLNCPLFKRKLKVTDKKIYGEKNSWRMEIKVA